MTKLKQPGAEPLQQEYLKLLSELPDNVYLKLDANEVLPDNVEGRSRAMSNLVSLHAGEIVELDPQRTRWELRRKLLAPGSASVAWENVQWNCREDGAPVGESPDSPSEDEYGQSSAQDAGQVAAAQVNLEQRFSQGVEWHMRDLMPDWSAQRNRCIVPCKNADTHEWLRRGPVATLGELFKDLGTDHTAKEI